MFGGKCGSNRTIRAHNLQGLTTEINQFVFLGISQIIVVAAKLGKVI